ncbi:MAG: cellulase family glycosylhydrolase, partial [Bacteroidota bacterium]|nr:cellulase family glycosylhydrolase [Bacteroidota bacterium]
LVSETAYFGVNLAGGEFGKIPGIYGKDYTYPTAGELDYYSSKGLRLFRLPFKWERLQPVLNGELDSTEVSRLMYVVAEADKRDMVVLLDCHNYGRRNIGGTNYIIGSPQVSVQSFANFWTRMAGVFKTKNAKKSNIWGYDIMNEPHDMLASVKWFDIAQEAIAGIRSIDLNTNIIVSGDGWSGAWVFGIPGSKSDILKNLVDPSNKLIRFRYI